MITQGIKRWLHSLFAWWPWKYSAEDDYAQTPTLNKGTTQETLFRTTVDGPTAQPGITSVAVEPIENGPISEASRSQPEEWPDRIPPFTHHSPSKPPAAEESSSTPRPTLKEATEPKPGSSRESQEKPAPTTQQRLEFLRYLVERGIVSENLNEKRDTQ